YDGNVLQVYFNGALENTVPWANGVFPGTAPLVLGSTLMSGSYFNGLLDEVSLYGVALTAGQIQAIFNAGNAGKCTAPTPPVITSQPADQTIVTGRTATFAVAARGSAPLSFQWSFNGVNIAGATTNSLLLSDVQLAQAGLYAVQVTNAFGSVLSSN